MNNQVNERERRRRESAKHIHALARAIHASRENTHTQTIHIPDLYIYTGLVFLFLLVLCSDRESIIIRARVLLDVIYKHDDVII